MDGINIDHKTIYVPWGKADIFFPTDFDALADMYGKTASHIWGSGKHRESLAGGCFVLPVCVRVWAMTPRLRCLVIWGS